ncbi:unnamed protein product [Aspergillus oryzae var. brunneus]|uniref:Unnamed protein product n=2 Tax=Aspergillus oryzae TaxID=5062 RepID=A0AAN5BVS2_ASPOZ|nr:unnamed protein product [Aspergillus oryzae]GMG13611.1 unnamed protein product [Aspergillus oryzae]GMG27022.1 unnamed protein product [Aspergillus oryzae]GMG44157.1 unnamed protein product [Aspergillus oryzae var. brunneus]
MKDEPAPDAKCKDKFLVQTVAVTRDMEFANVTSITPAVGAASKVANDTSPIPPPDFSDKRDIATPQTNESKISSAKAAIASAIPTSGEDLSAQLAEAKAQIQNLKDRLADQGLRQRKIGGETEKSAAPALQQQHAQSVEAGVPVQMVAGLCLLSFLIAYFFF